MIIDNNQVQPIEAAPSNSVAAEKCWACMEELKVAQRFCTNCSHWQGRYSLLNISTVVLSLLVAVFSVLGMSVASIVGALEGQPKPSLYVSGGADEKWEALSFSIENLNNIDRVLPYILSCEPFGGEVESTQQVRFYNTSPTLLRGGKVIDVEYAVDPKASDVAKDESGVPKSLGLSCEGDLSGEEEYKLKVSFVDNRTVSFSVIEK